MKTFNLHTPVGSITLLASVVTMHAYIETTMLVWQWELTVTHDEYTSTIL